MAEKIGVFGIGSLLMGDDGIAAWVIRELETGWRWPEHVEIVDLGTPGVELPTFVLDYDVAIFVDAVATGGAPGSIELYERAEILRHAPGIRLSPHDASLRETLLTFELAEVGPTEVVLVGVTPSATRSGIGLSPEVQAAVPRVVEVVRDLLSLHGVESEPRPHDPHELPWWEAMPEACGIT